MYSENPFNSFGRPVHEFHFLKVSRTLRNEKVIRSQATGSMDRKFGNHEIFKNIDAGERFRLLKSRNSFAGAISMLCGAPTYHSHDSYEIFKNIDASEELRLLK